jgi:hypothetical protein
LFLEPGVVVTPVIPALGRWRKGDCEFKASQKIVASKIGKAKLEIGRPPRTLKTKRTDMTMAKT